MIHLKITTFKEFIAIGESIFSADSTLLKNISIEYTQNIKELQKQLLMYQPCIPWLDKLTEVGTEVGPDFSGRTISEMDKLTDEYYGDTDGKTRNENGDSR